MRVRLVLFTLSIATLPSLAFSQASPATAPAPQATPTAQSPDSNMRGPRYAAQYQTGHGNNGIINAAAPNQTVVADPSYSNVERYTARTFAAPNNFHFEDDRGGRKIDFFHNWGFTPTFDANGTPAQNFTCVLDNLPPTGTGPIVNGDCLDINMFESAPGWSIGNPPVGPGGWQVWLPLRIKHITNGSGITESVSITQFKYGVGDNAPLYSYAFGEGGWTGASDEGTKAAAVLTQEVGDTYTGTVTSGPGTGLTSIKTTPVTGKGTEGTGRYLIDTTKSPVTGTIAKIANGLDGSESSVTVSTPVPVSNAWGKLATDVATSQVTSGAPFSTPETFNVNVTSGRFDTLHLVCFSSQYHECSFPTSAGTVSGGVQSITIPLRRPHAAGTYIFQGGMAGYGMEAVAYDVTARQLLRYLFDVVGSTSSNVVQALEWDTARAERIPLTSNIYDHANLSGLSNSGSTVSASYSSSGSTLGSPMSYQNGVLIIAEADDFALNGPCTAVTWTSPTAFNCTLAGLSGTHASAKATASLGLSDGTTLNRIKLWPMAEVIDVQDYSTNPVSVDGTFALEPNILTVAPGDTVEEPHHEAALFIGETVGNVVYNPFTHVMDGLTVTDVGSGVCCGNASPSSPSLARFLNEQPDSGYIGFGGFLPPPNMLELAGAYEFGLMFDHAPNSGILIDVRAAPKQFNNVNYSFYPIFAHGRSGAFGLNFVPYSGNVALTTPGAISYSAASHSFSGSITANGSNVFGGSNTINNATLKGTLSLPNSGVSPGKYNSANITVGADGRITSASSGTGSGSGPGGFPVVVAHAQLAGQTGPINHAVSYTPGAGGTFRVTATAFVTGPCKSGTITWGTYLSPVAGHNIGDGQSINCSTPYASGSQSVTGHNAAGLAISVSYGVSGTVGSGSFMVDVVVEQLQ